MKYYLAGLAITISVLGVACTIGWLADQHPMIFVAVMAILVITLFSWLFGHLIKATKETYGGDE